MVSVAPEAQGIVDAIKPDILKFHAMSQGNIEAIGLLFSEMARTPLPPQVICTILGMDEETVKAAFERGQPPTASEAQLITAVLNSVDPGDTVDMIGPVFKRHIQRFENSSLIMTSLREDLLKFHAKVAGNVAKIESFFADLAPEPQKGKVMPEGMINALLRIGPADTVCPLEDFLGCLERNLDLNDTKESIKTVLDAHMAR